MSLQPYRHRAANSAAAGAIRSAIVADPVDRAFVCRSSALTQELRHPLSASVSEALSP
jgi:hypothetical protein